MLSGGHAYKKADKRMSMRNEGCLIIGHANNYDTKDSNW